MYLEQLYTLVVVSLPPTPMACILECYNLNRRVRNLYRHVTLHSNANQQQQVLSHIKSKAEFVMN